LTVAQVIFSHSPGSAVVPVHGLPVIQLDLDVQYSPPAAL